jgi:hypothetical protein
MLELRYSAPSDAITNLRVRPPAIDLLPDRRQTFCNISTTLQCGIMKVVPCRRGAFQGRLTWVREGESFL